ncbi:MAG: hypothetical protein ABR875_03450 [Minisyncoccia bacterium]|jgi:hypothetical protein
MNIDPNFSLVLLGILLIGGVVAYIEHFIKERKKKLSRKPAGKIANVELPKHSHPEYGQDKFGNPMITYDNKRTFTFKVVLKKDGTTNSFTCPVCKKEIGSCLSHMESDHLDEIS